MPARNAASTLPVQLDALSRQTYHGPWELVVVDNGSSDQTAAVAKSWQGRIPALRVIAAAERAGINYARNRGAEAAKGGFLLFCDADDQVDEKWLEAMAEASDDCDLVGGYLDDKSLNEPEVIAWRPPVFTDRLPRALRFLPFAVGANCGIRSSILKELGGFDEQYAFGGEDVELFWRAQLASYSICFVPDAIVGYRYREGLSALRRQFYRYGRAEPQLYRHFAQFGVPRSRLTSALRTYVWIVWHLPDLFRDSVRRGVWVRKASYSLGRLVGSIRFRAIYL